MKLWIGLGSLFSAFSVILGAFGAHSLREQLTPEKLEAFKTATHYMSIHSLALLLVGILIMQFGSTYEAELKKVGILLTIGIVLFSGSIFVLSLGGPKFFGPITPLGGLSLVIGWFTLARTFFKKK